VRIRHFWYHQVKEKGARRPSEAAVAAVCDASGTIARLSAAPQPALGWFSRWIAILTTPFKFIGISGWEDTGCVAHARGSAVRDAQHSTDGFWTIDVALEAFTIGEAAAPAARFVRLEVEPETQAHAVCERARIREGREVAFGGPIVIDTDGPFLEVHPGEEFATQG
jgi:hypothetical protein